MEVVAKSVVSVLFKELVRKLGSGEVRSFARQLVGGVDSELEKLKTTLENFEELLLSHAEEKQQSEKAVKWWLGELQNWAYDAEDILDEFAYELALRRNLNAEEHKASSSKVLNLVTRPRFNFSMWLKIKKINSKLENLRKQTLADLDLINAMRGGTSSAVSECLRPEETSCVPPEQEVHGRDEDEAKLLEMVTNDQPSGANKFRVIAIVGMGGIGKTTIARTVYHHKDLEGFKFDKAWVCVSHNFDILTISKNIFGSLKHSSSSIPNNLNEAQVELQKAVNGKKFLIVLDDVWGVDYSKWEQLMSPFKAGASGSTMIVTTRNEDVAKTIRCSHIYHLKLLSKEACLSLFMEHALATGTAADADLIADSIRKRVIERCSGLPLNAKTLGGLLHSKPINTWERILDSEIWNSFKEKDILPVLKISYLYLPSHLKRCFAYCAVFPEDYEFEEKELILLWMAEGIIQQHDTQLDVAGQYFNDLCLRSFFQKSSNDDSKYIMHDLVHDLAELVSKQFSFRSETTIIQLLENVKRTHHFSYLPDVYNIEKKFEGLEKLKSLRTFLPVFTRPKYGRSDHYITATVIFYLLPKLEKLRVLSFERYYITRLPDSIGDLIHLRYLNFSYTRIESLPQSTSQLFNLQTLLLKNCPLLKLPFNMRYLTNLYHLDISGRNSLKEMPSRMRELKNLRTLSNFIVGKESDSNLEDLKSLSFLEGELHISKLENVNIVTQIGGPILSNKKDLKVLLLEWGSKFDGSRVERDEKDVLEMLKPHSNLEKLTIRFYGGLEFPSWLSTLSWLSKLTVLELENCENCTSLPPQSLLRSLEKLVIKGMPKLERINMRIPYRSLDDANRENENIESFPKLRELSIIECPKLTIELVDHLPSLGKLVIRKCAKWMVSFSSFPKLTKLDIDECKEVVCTTEFVSAKSESLPNIVESENWLSQNFNCVEKPLKWSHSLTSLKSLSIRNCSISFLNTIFLPNLSDLSISNCEALKSLPKRLKQNNIESLMIYRCDSLLFIARNTLPSSLKRLEISSCKKLQHLEGISSTLLEYLEIVYCESLTCVSSRGLLSKTLKSLSIDTCRNLTTLSRRRCVHKTLEYLSIVDCPKLKSIEEAYHNNPCLKTIRLVGLENLESNRLFGLHNLIGLEELTIDNCLTIEGIPTSLTYLNTWEEVEMSKTVIRWGLHSLTSLQNLRIMGLHGLTSLKSLSIWKDQRMPTSHEFLETRNFTSFRSISDVGTLTSLTDLSIEDSPNLESIPDLGSLVSLNSFLISECPNLKSIACLGSLTSLQFLGIWRCPELKSLPSLPPSLLQLLIDECPLLKKQLRRGKRKYCSKIAHIPNVIIDYKFIFNSKDAVR